MSSGKQTSTCKHEKERHNKDQHSILISLSMHVYRYQEKSSAFTKPKNISAALPTNIGIRGLKEKVRWKRRQ